MAIPIKNAEQIKAMKESCLIVAKTHEVIEKNIKVGMTTNELDNLADEYIKSCGGVSSFLGYNGYPASICVSINEEVIHGIPGLKKLKNGDIVSIDIGVYKNGFHGDAARTYILGEADDAAKKLVEVTKQSYFEGIELAKPGSHLFEISARIQEYVESFGFSVVRDFVGHGIGKKLHEDPQIPHYKMNARGPRLSSGMTLCFEPMVNAGNYAVNILKDNWTVVTKDGSLSAHYENTILITESGHEILTLI